MCIRNGDYPASLEVRKLYPVVRDDFAAKHDLIRVIDESGEDYLYPSAYFARLELSKPVEQKLRRTLLEDFIGSVPLGRGPYTNERVRAIVRERASANRRNAR